MSTKLAVLPWNENGSQRRFSSGKFHRRFTAFASFLDDVSDRIERRWIEYQYWDGPRADSVCPVYGQPGCGAGAQLRRRADRLK
jgi:hypothetical protein